MKQLSLFDIQSEEYEEIIQKQPTEEKDFNICPKCKVKPITWEKKIMTIDGWWGYTTVAKCPVCGYSVADIYDIIGHWNTCNRYRVRDGKL